jgi:transposase
MNLKVRKPYREVAKSFFPNATLIADKYHFTRQVTWAIENVRKKIQRTMTVSLCKIINYKQKALQPLILLGL